MNDEHSIMDEPTPQAPKHIAVFMAHADDAEFLCAGTVAKWTAEGNDVTYIIITNRDKGTEDPDMTGEALAARGLGERSGRRPRPGADDTPQ